MADDNESSPSIPEDKSTSNSSKSNSHAHLKQKRARSQLSCTPCRQGKLKCNRQHDPACDQCIKRSRESSCVYLPPPVKHKPAQNVKGRIQQLESLVVDLMNQNQRTQSETNGESIKRSTEGNNGIAADDTNARPFSQPTPPSDNDISPTYTEQSQQSRGSPEDVDSATTPFGQMKISKDEISYVGESHWDAILNSISDLKREVDDDDEEEEAGHDSPERSFTGPDVLFDAEQSSSLGFMLGGEERRVSRQELVNSVPEKKVADRLLSLWFNSPDPFKPIIHAPTFQDEYRRFWKNPRETPTMWLGLFYAILSLAASFGLRDTDPRSKEAQTILATVHKYHALSAGAAVLADFTKPKQHTLECLILYAAGLRSNNAFVNVWLMIGMVVRLALRMGYHRDPSHYSAISVFHGEMRRRVWSVIGMIDVLISFQLGLPSMFRTIVSDTQPPRNLLDRDFNSSTTVLPPSRSADELTPSSYTRAKLRIVRTFADAADLTHQTVAPLNEEIMRLDRELEEAKAAIPPLLQMPDISELVTDPAEQLMCRFNLDLLYLKTKIVIHRRYMLTPIKELSLAEQQRGIGDSRKACIESALRVLSHHHTIYSASQTGGQLESVKWYMGSISTHDFLLASMVICLELSEQINNRSVSWTPKGMMCPRRRAMMDSLEKSQQIWGDASKKRQQARKPLSRQSPDVCKMERGEHLFDETEKASRAMGVMLDKVKNQMANTPQPEGSQTYPPHMVQELRTVAPHVYTNMEELEQNPFTGVIARQDWNDMDGVPDNLGQMGNWGDTMHTSQYGGPSANPSLLNSTPDQTNSIGITDYSTIESMLDGPMSIDWETWDNKFIQGPQPEFEDWTGMNVPSTLTQHSDYNVLIGNAMTGGTGLVSGNATIPGGTGPGSAAYANVDFDINAMEFDMGPTNSYPWSEAVSRNGNQMGNVFS